MKKCIIIFLCLNFFIIAQDANAYLVDTGQPPIPSGSYGWSYHSNTLSEVWLAGEVTLTGTSNITAIQTYMRNIYPGTGTITIYTDGGNVPDTTHPIFSQNYATTSSQLNSYGWYGISGLNLNLGAATYWVSFEAKQKDGFYSALAWGAPNPLNAYASYNNGVWSGPSNLSFGLRVDGTESPVPLPAAAWLLGTGLAGLCIVRRKFK